MKQTLSLLLSMFAFILYAQHTDLKEYGYRGKVKEVRTKTFDKKGNELKADTAIFKWINEKTYILVYQYNNYFYEITTILNDDYRDYMGITFVYEWVDGEKKFRKAEISENFFGKDGHIEKIVVTDIQTQVKTTRFVKDKVLDKKGNLIQYKVYDDSNKLLQYVERHFEYEV